jgi:hypothetical protein
VPNTSFSNGFTSEVLFQNELEDMSQKKWLTRLQLTSFLHNSPPTSPNYFFGSCPQSLATYRRDRQVSVFLPQRRRQQPALAPCCASPLPSHARRRGGRRHLREERRHIREGRRQVLLPPSILPQSTLKTSPSLGVQISLPAADHHSPPCRSP